MNTRDDQKIQVQQATDIIRLIGEHVALRPRGREFIGLCPFHDDKNPSMYVSPAKQIYKCFSCGAGGDAFSFVMNYHKMTFPEALKHLADRAGIALAPLGGGHAQEGPSERQRIAQANELALGFFRALYRHAEHGQLPRQYVQQRRISPEMIEAFQLGYAPDRWDGLASMLQQKNWDRKAFELAGLVSQRSHGEGLYDRLRHRLIFPICDALGRPIAFGGRKLREEDEPKYLNSPETALFNKSATLYGLHLAKKPIIDSRTAVIVEGYTDVIACHQAGVRNVVATLGTALTPQHVTELRRYCDKVVLIYDGDEAGIKASDRAVEVFLTESLDVSIAVLPDELDPAELFELPDGIEVWNRTIGSGVDALAFQFDRLKQQMESADTITGRQHLAEEYLRKLAQLGLEKSGSIRRAMVLQRLAELLHMGEQALTETLRRLAPPGPRPPAGVGREAPSERVASAPVSAKNKSLQQATRYLVGCLISRPALFHSAMADGRTLDEAITPQELSDEPLRALYERVYGMLAEGRSLTLQSLLGELSSEQQHDMASLAIQCEEQVDQHSGGSDDAVAQLFRDAAASILAEWRERDYPATRSAAMATDEGPASSLLLREILEHHRANPSPVKIARVRK